MRISTIELAGTSKTELRDGTPGLPRAFARLSRQLGDDHITVELLTSCGERKHQVQADDRDDMWSMAECLQNQLDGYDGTNSEIDEYARVLQYFID